MTLKKFEIKDFGEFLKDSWAAFVANWKPLVGALLFVLVAIHVLIGIECAACIAIPLIAGDASWGVIVLLAVVFVLTIVLLLASAYFTLGYTRMILKVVRGQEA